MFLALVLAYLVVTIVPNKIHAIQTGKYTKYPPTAKGTWVPWFGHMFAFGKDPVKFFADQAEQVGEIVSFTLFNRDCVLMIGNGPQRDFFDAPEEVLSAAETYKFTVPCFGPNVVYDASEHKFQQHRKFAGNALTVKMFKLYVPKIEHEVTTYMNKIMDKDEGVVDFSSFINECTVLTSTACLQGPEIRKQVHVGYANLIAALDHALSAVGFFYPGLPLPTYIARNKARRELGTMFNAVIKHRRSSGFRGDDVLQTLMDGRYEDGSSLTDEEIVGNLIALMMAGQHTSNITSSWMMLNVLSNPKILERVRAEQDEIVGDAEHIDYEMVNQMNLLQNCMKETLLKNPPIITIWRTAQVDFEVDKYMIPKGTMVCVAPSSYAMSKNSVYTNIGEFDPDRFAPGREEHLKKTHSYIPFSTGRHACIGSKFAYLQVKSIFSVLARHFDLELVGNLSDYPTDNTSLLAAPTGPIMIKYKRRK
eukprot:TRINITY_DN8808_c0_g1_i1.p1 TRINITY_DN8808_c0_g1~~TRINITY_DN8808_c0_g1_i1.p1  ORF type:complete len:551 (-),score=138.29 TRINITY_DN8808_c0_g1_i1:210-1640(-)